MECVWRCLYALLMPGRYLKGVWKVFDSVKVVCRVCERIRKLSGWCLEVSGGVWMVSERCLDRVWRVSLGCPNGGCI